VTLSELLSTDLTTVGQWIRSGFAWWVSELAGMLPQRARVWFETRPSLTAEPLADGGYRLTRNGRTVMESLGAARRPRPVTLRLARGEVLIREAVAPPMAEHDLRRMLELDIDRLTPFRSDQVFVDVALGEAGSHRAIVAAIPRERAMHAMEQAWAAGLDPRALGVASASPAEWALDFLPKMREAQAVPRPSLNRALIWGVVAFLALANLGVAIGRDMFQLSGLRHKVEAQQAQVDQVAAVRRKVLTEQQRRADILRRRAADEPLRMLDAVTGAMPGGTWVDRLAWDGKSVRISGYRQEQIDAVAALRSAPLVSNVRNSGAGVLTRQAAGQPFDLTADLARAPGG
jgi:general secretion pathway protein L